MRRLYICPDVVDSVDFKESSLVRNCGELRVDSSSREDLKSATSNGVDERDLLQCYHYPSLENIATFGASHLDFKVAFVMFSPSTHPHARNILYFWAGRSLNDDDSQVQLDSDNESQIIQEPLTGTESAVICPWAV